MKNSEKVILILLFSFCGGCSWVTEVGRTLWGTSTRALEDARKDAITMRFNCTFDECYDAVITLASEKSGEKAVSESTDSEDSTETVESYFQIFHQNRIKGYIVVMNVPGNVNTTEVGIFFSRIKYQETRIDVSSLSSSAKRRVAEAIQADFNLRFTQPE